MTSWLKVNKNMLKDQRSLKFQQEDKFIFEIKEVDNILKIFLKDKNKKIDKSRFCEISLKDIINE